MKLIKSENFGLVYQQRPVCILLQPIFAHLIILLYVAKKTQG